VRIVVLSEEFIGQLNSWLPSQRGDRPSVGQFTRIELPEIMAVVAEEWESLPALEAVGYRRLIRHWHHVAYYAITAFERPDGAIELVNISFDFTGLPDPEAD